MEKLVVRRMMKSRYFSPSLILSPFGREDEEEGDAPSNKMLTIFIKGIVIFRPKTLGFVPKLRD
jgi:hypothetical protein